MFDVNTTSEEIMLDAGIPQETIDYAKNNSVQYVANGSDGAWNYADVTDSAGVTKTAWFTTRYARKSGSKFEISGGNIYFSVDTPDINANTNDISVAITYLDNSASDITVGYTSTDTADGLSGVTIPRSNIGKWVTSTFSLTDSTASITNSKTKLADGKADFKFNGGANFYIADIAITVNEDNKMTDNTLYVQDISYYKADSGNKTSDWLMSTTVSPQVTVVNKNADSVKAMLFAIVETNKGVRKSFAVSNMVSVPANGSALISATNDLPVGKWQSVRYSVITSNLKPIPIPEDDVINTVATYSGNTVTLKWDSYGEGYTYDVYRDGVLLSDGFNYTGTEYVDQDVASGRHVYQVRVKVDTALRKYYYGNYVAINVE